MIKNVKNIAPWTHAIEDLKSEKVVGFFTRRSFKR